MGGLLLLYPHYSQQICVISFGIAKFVYWSVFTGSCIHSAIEKGGLCRGNRNFHLRTLEDRITGMTLSETSGGKDHNLMVDNHFSVTYSHSSHIHIFDKPKRARHPQADPPVYQNLSTSVAVLEEGVAQHELLTKEGHCATLLQQHLPNALWGEDV